MFIYELSKDEKIQLEFKETKGVVEAKVLSRNVDNKFLIIEMSDFDLTKDTTANAYYPKKGTLIRWQNLNVRVIRGYEGIYFLSCEKPSINANRRDAYRVVVDKECEVSFAKQKKIVTYKAPLYDLSSSGFSVILDERLEESMKNAETKTLKFKDESLVLETVFSVKREIQLEDNKWLYGCKMNVNKVNRDLDKYINDEQRKTLKKQVYKRDLVTKKE